SFFSCSPALPALPSFPTRRSSDLDRLGDVAGPEPSGEHHPALGGGRAGEVPGILLGPRQVEHARHLVAVAEQHSVTASHLARLRSEEHTSELQSLRHLVCRLLLEK